MNDSIVAGVDIGGSHITVSLVNIDKKMLVPGTISRSHVDSGNGVIDIINAWTNTIKETFEKSENPISHVGIAMPGPFDYEKGIALMKNQNKYDALYGINVGKELAQMLELHPDNILFANDAVCFLEGEIFSGLGSEADIVLGLTLGTGFGSALCTKGKIVDADLWQHPFQDGIAEDFVSGRWLINRYAELKGERLAGVKQIVTRVEEVDCPEALQTFAEFGSNLGMFISPIIIEKNIDTVILGGNISKAYKYFSPSLHRSLTSAKKLNIQISQLGEFSALMGAAHKAATKVTNPLL